VGRTGAGLRRSSGHDSWSRSTGGQTVSAPRLDGAAALVMQAGAACVLL
jgi:hypothetical protein